MQVRTLRTDNYSFLIVSLYLLLKASSVKIKQGYIHTYMHVNNEKKALNLKENKKWYREGFGGMKGKGEIM